jgi:hypothetical protein
MRFNCGEAKHVRDAIRFEKKLARRDRLSEWHPFFALIPRRVGSRDCRWLEWIERKGTYNPEDGFYSTRNPWWSWGYRAKQKEQNISLEK